MPKEPWYSDETQDPSPNAEINKTKRSGCDGTTLSALADNNPNKAANYYVESYI